MTTLSEFQEQERVRQAEQSPRVQQFVRNMRRLREQKGWSTENFCAELKERGHDISRSVLVNLENSRRSTLTLDEAIAIEETLNTSLSWLCDFDGPACSHCGDNPPGGYACLVCRADTDVRFRPGKDYES